MNAFTDKMNAIFGAMTALLSYVLGDHWVLFVLFLSLNLGDYLTRWMAARLTGTENSKAGWFGILKKIGYWIMIALSFEISIIFMEIGNTLGLDLQVTALLGWFVLATLTVNEIRSILENLVEAGYDVPVVLIKGLEIANKAIDGKIKIGDDGIEIESHLTHDEMQAKGKTVMEIEDNRTVKTEKVTEEVNIDNPEDG